MPVLFSDKFINLLCSRCKTSLSQSLTLKSLNLVNCVFPYFLTVVYSTLLSVQDHYCMLTVVFFCIVVQFKVSC